MGLRRAISNFYNNFGEEPQYDEDYEDEEDYDEEGTESDDEVENQADDESNFGDDIGDGYGEDTIDPLDEQERAESGEEQPKEEKQETKKSNKTQNKNNNSSVKVKKKEFSRKMARTFARKHPFTMTSHVEARCKFCRKQSIVRGKKMYIKTGCALVNLFAHKKFTPFYCVNPRCKMSFQRDYIQIAAGISYEGTVVPMREILKVSKT